MKNQLLIIFLTCLFSQFGFGQVTIVWTGANNTTDWFDASNWNTGLLPDSADIVGISNAPDSMPRITGSSVIAGLILQAGSRCIIDTFAHLEIISPSGEALSTSGLLVNHGGLTIDAQGRGIGPTSGSGAIQNYGRLSVHSQNQAAIEYHDLLNYHTGSIEASSAMGHAIIMTDKLSNRGLIRVDSAEGSGLRTSGQDIVNICSGRLDLRNCQIGIEARGNFYNNAEINITNVNYGIVHHQIAGSGTFDNGDDQKIYIAQVTDTALTSDHFENLGYIEIHGQAGVTGIYVGSGQEFQNTGDGQLNLYGTFESSLSVSLTGQFFTNQFNEGIVYDDRLPWQYNRNEYNRMIDSSLRNFLIHVPEIYDSTSAVPILFMFHGSSGSGTKFYNISGWKEKANDENFIAVFPSSRQYFFPDDNVCTTRWASNGTLQSVVPGTTIADDVSFVRTMINLCKNTFNIDTSRIYMCGFSNGGAFVRTRLLDEMATELSAVAASGGYGLRELQPVPDSIYLPIYDLLGSVDDRALASSGVWPEFPYTADSLFTYPIVKDKVYNMAASVQVDSIYTEDSHLPAYNVVQFQDDLSGQGNEYKFAIIPGLGHMFANGTNHPVVYADILWPWFMMWTR